MSETRLTVEAQREIRDFLWRQLAVPGVLLLLLAGGIGFLINNIATKEAYNEAYKDASSRILGFASDVSQAATETRLAKQQAREIAQDVANIREKVITDANFRQTEIAVEDVAADLSDREDFRNRVGESIRIPTYDSDWIHIGQNCSTVARDIGFLGLPRQITAYYKIKIGNDEFTFPWGLNQYGDSHQTNGVLIDFNQQGTVFLRLPCGTKGSHNTLHLGTYKDRRGTGDESIVAQKNVSFRFMLWR